VNSARQLLQAFQRTLRVHLGLVECGLGQLTVSPQLVAGQAKPGQETHKFLLYSVVQVSLEPAPAHLFGLYEAGARGGQLLYVI
jgi:hypothetical protein